MRVHLCFDDGGHLPWDYLIRSAEGAEKSGAPQLLTSHSYFLFSDDPAGDVVIEAVPPMVRRLENPAPRPHCRSYLLAEGADALTVYAYACQHVGTLYDLPGLLVALGYVTEGQQDHFYEQHHDWVFCSELCTRAIRQVRPCLEGIDADVVTPAHLEVWAVCNLSSAD